VRRDLPVGPERHDHHARERARALARAEDEHPLAELPASLGVGVEAEPREAGRGEDERRVAEHERRGRLTADRVDRDVLTARRRQVGGGLGNGLEHSRQRHEEGEHPSHAAAP
jgi:hypothetical protein